MICGLRSRCACCARCTRRRLRLSERKRPQSAACSSGKLTQAQAHRAYKAPLCHMVEQPGRWMKCPRRQQRCRPSSLQIAEAHLLQSRLFLKQQRLDAAAREAEACIDLRRQALTMQHPAVAEALVGRVVPCFTAGRDSIRFQAEEHQLVLMFVQAARRCCALLAGARWQRCRQRKRRPCTSRSWVQTIPTRSLQPRWHRAAPRRPSPNTQSDRYHFYIGFLSTDLICSAQASQHTGVTAGRNLS